MDEYENSELPEVATLPEHSEVSTDTNPAQNDDWQQHQQRNWASMRQKVQTLEMSIKQRDDIIDKLLKNQPQVSNPVQYEPEEADDEFVPAGKVKAISKRSVQPLEEELKSLKQDFQKTQNAIQYDNLKRRYPDFDDVVNWNTLELLANQEPELAAMIDQLQDPYKMGLQSYKYIKALKLDEKVPNARRAKEVTQKIDRNEKAVQSPQAYEKRPMAQAYVATQADNKKLYEEMMFYASQANGL